MRSPPTALSAAADVDDVDVGVILRQRFRRARRSLSRKRVTVATLASAFGETHGLNRRFGKIVDEDRRRRILRANL